jgi:hypothetical protein
MDQDEGLSAGSDEDVDPVVDPQAYADAAAKQTASLPVNVVASLVPVIVMAAQGAGAFSTADGEGDRFDELIQSAGKPAPKTIVEQGVGSSSSRLTGCIISALDDAHAADLEKHAPRFRLVAYKLANVRASGDSRALSVLDGINNLSIDSRFFPTGDFNCHEASHRHVLAWIFLTFFKLWIPLKDASYAGLDFRIINTSMTKVSTKIKGGHGVTRAITSAPSSGQCHFTSPPVIALDPTCHSSRLDAHPVVPRVLSGW